MRGEARAPRSNSRRCAAKRCCLGTRPSPGVRHFGRAPRLNQATSFALVGSIEPTNATIYISRVNPNLLISNRDCIVGISPLLLSLSLSLLFAVVAAFASLRRRRCFRFSSPSSLLSLLFAVVAAVASLRRRRCCRFSSSSLLSLLLLSFSRICNYFHPPLILQIYVPTNPRGAERLPPCIVVPESDFYLRRLWGNPDEVGSSFSENFTILLFHYDGRTTEWDEFEWSKRAIHVSARKQTKWWYAKRFLHPDIVARYEYIFIWDEDLGLEHFDAEE
ncbi:hypothetical protein BHE74_00002264 [Ensete ventricosum]|nr:hypothetical protein BHE74_00002264 [Ensete ventricosum]